MPRRRYTEDAVDVAIRSKLGFEPERGRRAPPHRPGEGGLDELDVKILRVLNRDARKSFRKIAEELDVALSTVSSRVKHLEETGVIRGYAPVVDAGKLGFDLVVMVGVKIAHGSLLDVQQRIARNPRVFAVYDTTGDWDSLVLARFRDRDELNTFVKELLNTPDVERTSTQLVLNTVKDEKRVVL